MLLNVNYKRKVLFYIKHFHDIIEFTKMNFIFVS